MSGTADFAVAAVVLLGLLFAGMWIPFAIGVAYVIALWMIAGVPGLRAFGITSWASTNSFTLTAVPMFILMAEILLRSGVSGRSYDGLSKLARNLPGGLLQTNILGCAFFAAISGSSVATAAAIGTVALPQLEQRKYDRRMSAGSLAAGGTLGILIPPSIALIVYGSFTETSIAKLFMAGLVPGILLALLFMAFIAVMSILRPEVAPKEPPVSRSEKLKAVLELLPFGVLMVTVLGSLYTGIATPTEAAALGCAVALAIGFAFGKMDWSVIHTTLLNTVRISCTIMLIILTAYLFSYAVEMAGVGTALTNWFLAMDMNRYTFLLMVVIVYCLLGCILDSIGMIVLTVPLLLGPLTAFGFDPIWFGIILVLLLELGQITPPIGMNLFVVQSTSQWPLGDVVRGTAPYWLIIILFIGVLTLFPEIALTLPENMFEARPPS